MSRLLLYLLYISAVEASSTCTSNVIDIAMCLDNSGSMGSGYTDVQQFSKDVVSKFTISDTNTRVAVLKFSTSSVDTTFGFSGSASTITDTLDLPLTGGTTNTHRCIDMAKNLFASDGRANAAQLMLIITDGAPTNQIQTETAAEQARAAGIVIVGVGASIGYYGRDNILRLTSNQCPANHATSGCSDGLTDPPGCTSPCNDHYMDAQTMADLSSIIDNVVDIACVNPGCQYNWGSWSKCSEGDTPTRSRSPVINYNPGTSAGQPGACPGPQSEGCTNAKCKAKADFLLLLDSSGSMGNCDWASQAWFAKEFVERLPYVGQGSSATFELAQVGVVQFSSDPHFDHALTTSRSAITGLLDCGSSSFTGTCGDKGGTCDSWAECSGDKCCDYSSECAYKQESGGTNTAIAMMEAIKVLMTGRPDARKVIILATDGQPTGNELLPNEIRTWCQSKAMTLYSREDSVLCMSKYAQSTTAAGAPNTPAAIGCNSWNYCSPAMEPLEATVVTVGINVRTNNVLLNNHFKEVASDPSLYIPVTDVNGGNLDETINSLISKSCPPIDCKCKDNTPWGLCKPDSTRTKPCIPEVFPDNGGAPCVSESEPCGDCIWSWGPYGACDPTTGKKSRGVDIVKDKVGAGKDCETGTQEDICDVNCEYTWPSFGTCDVNTGKQSRAPTITTTPKNDGVVCPDDEVRNCPIDCVSSWNDWSACNKNSGKQIRTATITRNPMNGGVACPAPEERTCGIDCEYVWKPWSACNLQTGKQGRSITITTQPLNGGNVCPPDQTRNCGVDCVSSWDAWSTCNPQTGKQNRQATVTVPSLNSGVTCPAPETRNCPIDCTYNWEAWNTCSQTSGKQQRSISITTPCLAAGNCPSGVLFGGTVCPPDEERICPIDCQSEFTAWDECNKISGKQGRTTIIKTPCFAANNCPLGFLNGGQACPPPEDRACPVDCEYVWGEWDPNPCTSGDTTRTRTVQVSVTQKNSGVACPPPETIPCDVTPCIFTWGNWGVCNLETGKQERVASILELPINGGKLCPGPESRNCKVDCTSDWNEWTICDKHAGSQTRDITKTTKCFIAGNCPSGSLNEGVACPPKETRLCDIECEFLWPIWGVCDKLTGKQERTPTITVPALKDGKICPSKEIRDCDIDCEFHWNEWTICDISTGKQGRTTTVTVPALNGADACPPDQARDCDIDCEYTWKPWAACDQTTGKQVRDPEITIPAINTGVVCPTQEERDCPVDCVSKFTEWGVCPNTGVHERTVIIETPCFPLNLCPGGYLNGGTACPPKESKTCRVDCERYVANCCCLLFLVLFVIFCNCFAHQFILLVILSFHSTHDEWSICDATKGDQSRGVTIAIPPLAGGAECLQPETRKCRIDCKIKWNVWRCDENCQITDENPLGTCDKMTGKQNRDHTIDVLPKDGYDGQGAPCPPHEKQDCLVNCEGYWGQWSTCASPNGNYPPFTRTRSYIITVSKKNGGNSCPPSDTEPCLSDICYSAESKADSSGAKTKEMDLRPLRTLSPGHPAFSRKNCGGPLQTTDDIPTVDKNQALDCTGPNLFYAYDATTKRTKTTMVDGKDGVSQIFFIQDSDSQVYFGMMNGSPNVPKAYADIGLEFTGISNKNKNVDWVVKNDPTIGSTTNCKMGSPSGNDCYEWDLTKKEGNAKWEWVKGQSSGGMIGPLPSYGFCAKLKIGDVNGINTYEFAAYGKTETGSGPYVTAHPFSEVAFDNDLEVCVYACALAAQPPVPKPPDNGSGSGATGGGATGGGASGGGASGESTTTAGAATGSTATSGAGSGEANGSGNGGDGGGIGSTTSAGGSGSGTASNDGGNGVVPASCSTGKVNAARDGCESSCSTGKVNAAGDGCESSCSTGKVNADGSGCNDADATLSPAGTFSEAGTYKPPSDNAAGDVNNNGGGGGEGGGGAGSDSAVMFGAIGGGVCCLLFLLAAILLVQRRKKGGRRATMTNEELPPGWSSFVDEASGYPCYVNDQTGDTQWEKPKSVGGIEMQMSNPMKKGQTGSGHHARNSTQMPSGWDKHTDEEGNRYYSDGNVTSWDAPPGATGGSVGGGTLLDSGHARSETQLPHGWERDFSGSDKYYFNEATGETTWDAPPGSKGGSSGM